MCLAFGAEDGGEWVTVQPRRAAKASAHGSERAPLRALNAASSCMPPGAVQKPDQQPAASPVTSSAVSAAARSAAVGLIGARAHAAVGSDAFQPARQDGARAAELLGLAHRFPHLFPLLPAPQGQGPWAAAHGCREPGSPGSPRASFARDLRCVACTPRGRCAKHRRAAVLALAPRRVPTPAAPAGATVLRADRDAFVDLAAPALGAEERAAVLSAAAQLSTRRSARKASSVISSADSASDTASSESAAAQLSTRRSARKASSVISSADSASDTASSESGDESCTASALELATDWAAQRRNARVRERAMRLAGWAPRPGAVGEHPQWRRTLPGGLVQCIAVPGSPSDCRHWDNQSAMLRRLDRAARGEA
jgi:hypothetical protein